ncbi:hypothetical protein Bhyg_17490 [Pseudolycoriella hygida]|uniref:Uncharacterized protein n=1 Tax=Pseudolycoriella hygida TaxID=35572 RepID=A0A9Q0MK80_9DIPT|nr:hypothetical protein Bhyg_17490 [Pseudolycoriella hygida]
MSLILVRKNSTNGTTHLVMTFNIIFVIFLFVYGSDCLSLGDVTAESELIFSEFFNHTGFDDGAATRVERINTTKDISAIRGIDVSGQDGDGFIMSYSPRSVELLISAEGKGRGFNFSLQLYHNAKTGAGQKTDAGQKSGANSEIVPIVFEFFNHTGFDDGAATRVERINTTKDISAIRGIDVSGQDGDGFIMSYSPRSVELLISAEGKGRGFNFSLQLYHNAKTGAGQKTDAGQKSGANSEIVPIVLLVISVFLGSKMLIL